MTARLEIEKLISAIGLAKAEPNSETVGENRNAA
jgi:hypothetical protein